MKFRHATLIYVISLIFRESFLHEMFSFLPIHENFPLYGSLNLGEAGKSFLVVVMESK